MMFTTGNLLDAETEALVNTVNTVGVMGRGIALMFKEAFPENTIAYEKACKLGDVRVGHMFVTVRESLIGPKWIINFPTKEHWRNPSRIEWIREGLKDLRRVICEEKITSIALPPLGSGNGGLLWADVRQEIHDRLSDLTDVEIVVFEPTDRYLNVRKRIGVEKLTPARALVAELVRRYWILGFECTLLEIQKLAYLLEDSIFRLSGSNPMELKFSANRYGPYAHRLGHLLNALDGSYLHCEKRITDAGPLDVIRFDDSKRDKLSAYLTTAEAKIFKAALEDTSSLIDGFESPLGMELLATVHWLINRMSIPATVKDIKDSVARWPGGDGSGVRKQRIFDDRLIAIALNRLTSNRDHEDA